MSHSNPQSSPSATTKSLEEILLDLLEHHDVIPYGRACDTSCTDMHVDQPTLEQALAAINNYTTQRVIGELENAAARNGAEVTPSKLVAAYLRIRLNQLKGGIDE